MATVTLNRFGFLSHATSRRLSNDVFVATRAFEDAKTAFVASTNAYAAAFVAAREINPAATYDNDLNLAFLWRRHTDLGIALGDAENAYYLALYADAMAMHTSAMARRDYTHAATCAIAAHRHATSLHPRQLPKERAALNRLTATRTAAHNANIMLADKLMIMPAFNK